MDRQLTKLEYACAINRNTSPAITQKATMPHMYKIIGSPVGELKLVADGHHLMAILWEREGCNRVPTHEVVESGNNSILQDTERQPGEYFVGERRDFDLPLRFNGTTFQKQVWAALLTIPFGETRTYRRLPPKSVMQGQDAPSAQQMGEIPCQSSLRVIELSVRPDTSQALLGASMSSKRSWIWKRGESGCHQPHRP